MTRTGALWRVWIKNKLHVLYNIAALEIHNLLARDQMETLMYLMAAVHVTYSEDHWSFGSLWYVQSF